MTIINSSEFDAWWEENGARRSDDEATDAIVREILASVRDEGDAALRRYTARFDKSVPERFEMPSGALSAALAGLESSDPELAGALRFAAANISRFASLQRAQFSDFESETVPGVFTGQCVLPVARAAVYIPGGRFPLISSALMCVIPALAAGVGELVLATPPGAGSGKPGSGEPGSGEPGSGEPDARILAAAAIAAEACGREPDTLRLFAMGGAQAVAALAYGKESVPRCDVIAGPGNKYVAAAKRLLAGVVGIDLVAGPTDVLVITDASSDPDKAAADMLAQAEHDDDARARAIVSDNDAARLLEEALDRRLASLPTASTAKRSLDSGGLIVVCGERPEAARIANAIAPEHLELQTAEPGAWTPLLQNFGSLFIGEGAAEVLGDYSAGINHTLPTSGSARFTGGLSVRHFLRTATSLRCDPSGKGRAEAARAAEIIAEAEGLSGHARSAALRK